MPRAKPRIALRGLLRALVLAIAGLIMAVGVPTLWTYWRAATTRAGAEEMVAVLNNARQLAIRLNSTVCVTNTGTRLQYHVGTCAAAAWTGPGTDTLGFITLANAVTVAGAQNLCFSYLGAGTATPAPCIANTTFTVTNPNGNQTLPVIVAASGRVRIGP